MHALLLLSSSELQPLLFMLAPGLVWPFALAQPCWHRALRALRQACRLWLQLSVRGLEPELPQVMLEDWEPLWQQVAGQRLLPSRK